MAEWQAIETAPRDQWVLLFDRGRYPSVTYFVGVRDREDLFVNDEGRLIWSPTHWMPLPDPPEE